VSKQTFDLKLLKKHTMHTVWPKIWPVWLTVYIWSVASQN